MGILSIIGTLMLAISIFNVRTLVLGKVTETSYHRIGFVKEIGLLALITGVLATTINLMGAFQAIESAGDVPMSLLAGGLKYAVYTLIYGMIIYILSLLITLVLRWGANKSFS